MTLTELKWDANYAKRHGLSLMALIVLKIIGDHQNEPLTDFLIYFHLGRMTSRMNKKTLEYFANETKNSTIESAIEELKTVNFIKEKSE